ncbi:MAG: trigger factor [Prevotellaceae bacterium]|jgi:trigger factor|nr:trigger factor [Prevotellaceae bacterium]
MNIARADIDALNAMLTVKVEKADYETGVEATLRDYRRKAQIPGFRPGMVPMGVIKKMYQKSITADEVFKKVSEGISQYIKDNQLHVLGEPLPNKDTQSIDFDTQTDFEFTYDVALAPAVQLNISKQITVPYYTVSVTDDEVQQRINAYRRYYGKMVPLEKIEKNALVRVDLTQHKENAHSVKAALLSLMVIPEAEQETLLGLAVGNTVEVNVRKLLTNDADCAAFLSVTKERLATIDPVFTLTIGEITSVELAEISQSFFDDLYGKDVVTSEEAFADRVKSELHSEAAGKSERRFAADVRSTLMERASLKLPEAFLKRWLLLTSDGKMTEDEVEKDFPSLADSLRWQLITEHILKQENIEVTEDDLLTVAKQTVLQRLTMYYGTNNISEDRLTEFARAMLNRSEERDSLAKHAAQHQVIAYIRGAVTVEQKEVSHEQLKGMLAEA